MFQIFYFFFFYLAFLATQFTMGPLKCKEGKGLLDGLWLLSIIKDTELLLSSLSVQLQLGLMDPPNFFYSFTALFSLFPSFSLTRLLATHLHFAISSLVPSILKAIISLCIPQSHMGISLS